MTSRTLTLLAAATLGITGLASGQMARESQGSTPKPPDQSTPAGASQSDANRTGTDAAQSDNPAAPAKISDREFVQRAVSSGSYEVDASKWVQDKAKDPQIKQLAKTMESDHKQANNDLKELARQGNIAVPSGPQGSDQQMLSQLKQADEQQIDQKYLQQMIQAHQEGIDLFRQAQAQLQDPKLKSFAQRTLPKLEEHLQHLQQMSAQPAGGAMPGNKDNQPNQPGESGKDYNKPSPKP